MSTNDPLRKVLAESFCYGDVSLCRLDQKITPETYNFLIENFKKSDSSRDINGYWCLIRNIKSIETISIEYIDFISEIFDILDQRLGVSTEISFDSPFVIKLYVINELLHTLTAIAMKNGKTEFLDYFAQVFNTIIKFIKEFRVTTIYNVPNDMDFWFPSWKLEYKDMSIKDSSIDIFTDTIINNPKIKFYSGSQNVMERVTKRLQYLKQEAPCYFNFLEGVGILAEFSHYSFHKYPYNEIAKSYIDMIKLSTEIFVPENLRGDNIDYVDLIFELIPESLSTYLLGFSNIAGSMSKKLIRKNVKCSKKEGYFESIEAKNSKFIDANMFHERKIGNSEEDGVMTNVLYLPVASYNVDDIAILYSNDFYYVFTYPEFQNLSETSTNIYNRKTIDNGYINMIRDKMVIKNIMKEEVAENGLSLELNGTMKENYMEFLENIKTYTHFSPKQGFLPEHMISLLFPGLN